MTHLYNLLSNIQTGIIVRHKNIDVKRTRLNLEVLNLLYREGFIDGFSISLNKPNNVCVFLKYINERPVLRELKVISVPSKRIYVSYETIMRDLVNRGVFVISTNQYGLVLADDFVKNYETFSKTGGELLFQIIF